MDSFDYIEERPALRKSTIVFNVLTGLVILLTLCMAGFFLVIFINPNSSLNLFPPPTLPAALALPTSTPTPRSLLPPTWTPLPSEEPTSTPTSRPTATVSLLPTETPFPLFADTPAAGSNPPASGMPYILEQGSPEAMSSAAFHPEAGCAWFGVAGQILDLYGDPVSTGIIIQAGGTLNGRSIDLISLTGVATRYGPAGFEIFLADQPAASENMLWLQLFDQAGQPLSEKVYFETFADCRKNLIFINFRQAR